MNWVFGALFVLLILKLTDIIRFDWIGDNPVLTLGIIAAIIIALATTFKGKK